MSAKWKYALMIFSGFLMGLMVGRMNSKPHVLSVQHEIEESRIDFQQQHLKGTITTHTIEQRAGNILDGCRYVYLDVGSNIGIQVRKLYEPEKFPSADAAIMQYFDTLFGNAELRRQYPEQVCAVGFELNPLHEDRLKGLEKCYNLLGKKTYFHIPVAISNIDGEKVTMISPEKSKFMYWGASVTNNYGYQKDKNAVKFEVPTMDLGKYIMDVVATRKIPQAKHKDAPPPSVLMKLDVEGSEYQVLTGMLIRGAFSIVNMITIEYHRLHETKGNRNPDLSDADIEYSKQFKSMIKTLLGSGKKYFGMDPIQILEVDDETYFLDNTTRPIRCNFEIPYTN